MIVNANALHVPLADKSVQCIVTSPPYWGLRNYGVSGQLGLERTPEEYIANMVSVFRECWRVLRDDGTLWLNVGDSYASQPAGNIMPSGFSQTAGKRNGKLKEYNTQSKSFDGLKPKDLVGIPWRLAFALQAEGWVLRSEIIWNKPNPMPESVIDRPTKAHEQLFLFSKAKWIGPERGRFADISDSDARWIALFIETEGNICVKRVRKVKVGDQYGVQVAVANASKSLLEELQRIVGAGNILERGGKNAPIYYWQISNKVARDLLYRIYPFMIAKKRQARIGIYLESLLYHRGGRKDERKWRTDKETILLEKLWENNKSCNQFGEPDLSYVPEPIYGHWDSQPYYYDQEAIKEGQTESSIERSKYGWHGRTDDNSNGSRTGSTFKKMAESGELIGTIPVDGFRNRRTVWTIPTAPYKGAHFATFPPALVEPCIKAGTSERGACPKCGKGWRRIVDHKNMVIDRSNRTHELGRTRSSGTMIEQAENTTLGWQPSCTCDAGYPIPCLVFDPFVGSGTTVKVAYDLGRRGVGLDLSLDYLDEQARKRIHNGYTARLF